MVLPVASLNRQSRLLKNSKRRMMTSSCMRNLDLLHVAVLVARDVVVLDHEIVASVRPLYVVFERVEGPCSAKGP